MTPIEAIRSLLTKAMDSEAMDSKAMEFDILENEPMAKYTSFKIGGNAEVLARPKTTDELAKIWQTCRQHDIPFTILGDGTNVLVSDEGIKGVVVLTNKMSSITIDGNKITATAGVRLAKLAEEACKAGLAGLEFASGIPGTVGGAVYMNAGAYGHDISNVCESVKIQTPAEAVIQPVEQMQFGYRKSKVQQGNQLVLEATFKLTQGDPTKIREEMTSLNNRRRESQPLDYPSAGSTFKRPEGYFAGKLIQDSGLKGFQIGGAQVSEKHAGFVINKGNATAKDVKDLIEAVRQKVHENFGVWLEPEIRMLGV